MHPVQVSKGLAGRFAEPVGLDFEAGAGLFVVVPGLLKERVAFEEYRDSAVALVPG